MIFVRKTKVRLFIRPINALSTSLRKYHFRDKIPRDLHNGRGLYVSSKRVYVIIRNASDILNFLRHFRARIYGINRYRLTFARYESSIKSLIIFEVECH